MACEADLYEAGFGERQSKPLQRLRNTTSILTQDSQCQLQAQSVILVSIYTALDLCHVNSASHRGGIHRRVVCS